MTIADDQGRHLSTVLEILERLASNESRAELRLSMVPSENQMSALARTPLLLDVYNRYFFNVENESHLWQFRGGQDIWDIEGRVIAELRGVLDADHVSIRPLSGINAMTLTFAALAGPPGSAVVTVARPQGGHPSARPIAERLGLRVSHLGGTSPHDIDLADVARVLERTRPGLIYIDQSSCLFPTDITALSEVVRRVSPESLLHVDVSHWLGLIIGGALPNPLRCGADSISASTHKTFPGPQKAIIATNDESVFGRVRQSETVLLSSHHYGASLSLGLALFELLATGRRDYASNVVANTRTFGELLANRGLVPECRSRGYSAGHQLWLSTERIGVDAYALSGVLKDCGVLVNPLDDLPDMPKPSLRLGLHEATYRGFGTDELATLADVFLAATAVDADVAAQRGRVERLCQKSSFPYQLVDDGKAKSEFLTELVGQLRTRVSARQI
jgi:glycine hydroxymethyltransferase